MTFRINDRCAAGGFGAQYRRVTLDSAGPIRNGRVIS